MDGDKPALTVVPPSLHRPIPTTRLRDVVRTTELRIRDGAQRPPVSVCDYADLKAAYEIIEMLAESMEDTGCLHAVAGSLLGEQIRKVMRGG